MALQDVLQPTEATNTIGKVGKLLKSHSNYLNSNLILAQGEELFILFFSTFSSTLISYFYLCHPLSSINPRIPQARIGKYLLETNLTWVGFPKGTFPSDRIVCPLAYCVPRAYRYKLLYESYLWSVLSQDNKNQIKSKPSTILAISIPLVPQMLFCPKNTISDGGNTAPLRLI